MNRLPSHLLETKYKRGERIKNGKQSDDTIMLIQAFVHPKPLSHGAVLSLDHYFIHQKAIQSKSRLLHL